MNTSDGGGIDRYPASSERHTESIEQYVLEQISESRMQRVIDENLTPAERYEVLRDLVVDTLFITARQELQIQASRHVSLKRRVEPIEEHLVLLGVWAKSAFEIVTGIYDLKSISSRELARDDINELIRFVVSVMAVRVSDESARLY